MGRNYVNMGHGLCGMMGRDIKNSKMRDRDGGRDTPVGKVKVQVVLRCIALHCTLRIQGKLIYMYTWEALTHNIT